MAALKILTWDNLAYYCKLWGGYDSQTQAALSDKIWQADLTNMSDAYGCTLPGGGSRLVTISNSSVTNDAGERSYPALWNRYGEEFGLAALITFKDFSTANDLTLSSANIEEPRYRYGYFSNSAAGYWFKVDIGYCAFGNWSTGNFSSVTRSLSLSPSTSNTYLNYTYNGLYYYYFRISAYSTSAMSTKLSSGTIYLTASSSAICRTYAYSASNLVSSTYANPSTSQPYLCFNNYYGGANPPVHYSLTYVPSGGGTTMTHTFTFSITGNSSFAYNVSFTRTDTGGVNTYPIPATGSSTTVPYSVTYAVSSTAGIYARLCVRGTSTPIDYDAGNKRTGIHDSAKSDYDAGNKRMGIYDSAKSNWLNGTHQEESDTEFFLMYTEHSNSTTFVVQNYVQ